MGLGHYLTEEVVHDSDNARLLTRGTWSVHIASTVHTVPMRSSQLDAELTCCVFALASLCV